jgi:hypothetical protein
MIDEHRKGNVEDEMQINLLLITKIHGIIFFNRSTYSVNACQKLYIYPEETKHNLESTNLLFAY